MMTFRTFNLQRIKPQACVDIKGTRVTSNQLNPLSQSVPVHTAKLIDGLKNKRMLKLLSLLKKLGTERT